MSKDGYEPIPDVELGLESSEDAKLAAKERYPDANEKEVELLGILDKCIERANVTVDLPDVSPDAFGRPTTNCCCAAIFPTLVFLTLLAGALWQSKVEQPLPYVSLYATYLPYMVAMIIFLASIEPISTRMMSQASKALTLSRDAQEEIESVVDFVGVLVESNVKEIQGKLNTVVDRYRPVIKRASKVRKVLKKADPSVDIPSVEEVERELEGATDDLDNNIGEVKASISVDQFIPPVLRSPGAYRCRVIFPTLLWCLAFQMIGAFAITYVFPLVGTLTASDTSLSGAEMNSDAMHRTLEDIRAEIHMPENMHMPENIHMSEDIDVKKYVGEAKNFTESMYEEAEVFAEKMYEEAMELALPIWPFVLLICEAYAMAILQITFIYIMSRPLAWLHTVRYVRNQVKDFANQALLEKGTIFICKDVLLTRMQRVKDRVLLLISTIGKLNKALDKVSHLLSDSSDDDDQDKRRDGSEPLRLEIPMDNPVKKFSESFSKFFSPR